MFDGAFLVPFNHEHISKLAGLFDDVVDKLEKSANRLVIFEISYEEEMFKNLSEFLQDISEAVKELKEAITLLKERRHLVRIYS
jgi:uncharacterized protein Yka (UPF0111/DUF47 family)